MKWLSREWTKPRKHDGIPTDDVLETQDKIRRFMKKQRGLYRKINTLFNKIELFEPQKKDKIYEEFVVPSNNFLDISKSNIIIKFINKWLETTEKFIKQNISEKYCKIVGIIETNEISNSRIIFFYDEEYYNNFWKRNNSYQTWDKLDSKKSLKQKLNIQTDLKEIGFKETINDEDFKYETELWVYGDIEDIE